MAESAQGKVCAIAVRTEKLGPMREIGRASVVLGGGVEGDIEVKPRRGVTLIAKEQWERAMRELNADLPWHTRRANVLVEGLDLSTLIGRTVRIGTAEVLVHGETKPCALMDALHEGLKDALTPDMRAGVHAEVIFAGEFAVGDAIAAVE